MIDLNEVIVDIQGIDLRDLPDLCDAFIAGAWWADTGQPLTPAEIDTLQDCNPDEIHEMAVEMALGG